LEDLPDYMDADLRKQTPTPDLENKNFPFEIKLLQTKQNELDDPYYTMPTERNLLT
jgi:hypothetical protein